MEQRPRHLVSCCGNSTCQWEKSHLVHSAQAAEQKDPCEGQSELVYPPSYRKRRGQSWRHASFGRRRAFTRPTMAILDGFTTDTIYTSACSTTSPSNSTSYTDVFVQPGPSRPEFNVHDAVWHEPTTCIPERAPAFKPATPQASVLNSKQDCPSLLESRQPAPCPRPSAPTRRRPHWDRYLLFHLSLRHRVSLVGESSADRVSPTARGLPSSDLPSIHRLYAAELPRHPSNITIGPDRGKSPPLPYGRRIHSPHRPLLNIPQEPSRPCLVPGLLRTTADLTSSSRGVSSFLCRLPSYRDPPARPLACTLRTRPQ